MKPSRNYMQANFIPLQRQKLNAAIICAHNSYVTHWYALTTLILQSIESSTKYPHYSAVENYQGDETAWSDYQPYSESRKHRLSSIDKNHLCHKSVDVKSITWLTSTWPINNWGVALQHSGTLKTCRAFSVAHFVASCSSKSCNGEKSAIFQRSVPSI